uniref:Uncharacterized protein n=1 Tax=Anguilla anguilla TaxID=7936 RepID=A0A0E9XYS9_ANGAN
MLRPTGPSALSLWKSQDALLEQWLG